MRRRIVTVWLVAATSVVAACSGSSNSTSQGGAGVAQAGAAAKTDKAADEAALRAIYQKVVGQFVTGDSAYGALFADDGVEMLPGMAPSQGPDAVKKEVASVLASMKDLKITMGDAVVTVADAGDLAVVKAPYHLTYTDAKGKKVEDHGSSMTVFKKVNGQWKILYDTNASEVAPQ